MNIKTQTCVGCGPPPVYVQAAAEVVTVCACHFVVFVIAMMHNMRSACCTDASRSRRKVARTHAGHVTGATERTYGNCSFSMTVYTQKKNQIAQQSGSRAPARGHDPDSQEKIFFRLFWPRFHTIFLRRSPVSQRVLTSRDYGSSRFFFPKAE